MTYLIGGLFVVSGAFIVYGAITGRLATMMGALVGAGKSGASSKSQSGIGSITNPSSPNFPSPIPGLSMGNLSTAEGWAKKLGL